MVKPYKEDCNMARNNYSTWNDVPALIDLEQASTLLGLSIESVRRYCVIGDIPAIQIGKQWRIDKQSLMKKFGYL
jgi:excisionase family DNA binding protein